MVAQSTQTEVSELTQREIECGHRLAAAMLAMGKQQASIGTRMAAEAAYALAGTDGENSRPRVSAAWSCLWGSGWHSGDEQRLRAAAFAVGRGSAVAPSLDGCVRPAKPVPP